MKINDSTTAREAANFLQGYNRAFESPNVPTKSEK